MIKINKNMRYFNLLNIFVIKNSQSKSYRFKSQLL